jgi:putative flippase GtrA
VRRILREALGYGAVSAISLGADFGILAVLVQWLHWPTLIAAATSFLSGACIAYALSVRYVFSQHRLRSRRAEFIGFVALGTIGLAVNLAVIWVATELLGMHVLLGKCLAAGASFSCNFLARRQILFVQP